MTDHEIIQGLIARDDQVTKEFFFVKCRPLFRSIMKCIFSYEVDYDEMVNELYLYLMEDDAAKLRKFQYRSSVYQWIKVLSIRFYIKKRDHLIDNTHKETPYDGREVVATDESNHAAKEDLQRLFTLMPNKRYVYVIRRLMIEDWEPGQLALEQNITTANLYNIKRRAMAQLTRIALNDIREYGK